MKDLISDYLSHKKNDNKNIIDKENEIESKPDTATNEEVLEQITEQFNKLETVPRKDVSTPPSSPAEYKTDVEINVVDRTLVIDYDDKGKAHFVFK